MVAKAMANQDRANAEQQAMINRLADEFSNGKVNDKTEAVVRVKGNYEFGDSTKGADATIDRAYVDHKFGNRVSAKGGRFQQTIGGGLMYDDTFDGAQLNVGNDKVQVQGAYGYMMAGAADGNSKSDNPSVAYVGVKGKVGQESTVGGFYSKLSSGNLNHNGSTVSSDGQDVYGDIAKKGTWDVKGQYFNQKANAPIVSSTWDQAYDLTNTSNGYKGYMASVNYAVQDNVGLSAGYGFNSKDQKGNDLSDFYRAELNYKF